MNNIVDSTVAYLKNNISNFEPEIAVILGSGLGNIADACNGIKIPYCTIPGFGISTVEGHKGQLVFADFYGKKVVFMQGRFHFYEGYPMQTITYPFLVFKELGVKKIIITNAAGGINESFSAGDFMLIDDHINFMGTNPLVGVEILKFGERFPDMSEVYSKRLGKIVKDCALNLEIELKSGVYAAMSGPSYETPAEIRMLRLLGADAVGMSTVPEAIFSNYCGMEVVGISCITNMAAGVSNDKLSHSEVIATADIVSEKFKKLIISVIKVI